MVVVVLAFMKMAVVANGNSLQCLGPCDPVDRTSADQRTFAQYGCRTWN